MAYDEDLAHRIRALTQHRDDITEKRMFGGLAFLVRGNMAVAASSQGDLMVRADPAHAADHLGGPVSPMEMRGRPMAGWLRVSLDGLDDAGLARWVEVGTTYAAGLDPK